MPRPDPRAPKLGQQSLFDVEATATKVNGQVTRGRHSEAIDRSIHAAYTKGYIEDVDEAAVTLLRAIGTNFDEAERQRDLWAVSKALPGAVDLLDRLHMTPESRVTEGEDEMSGLIRELMSAEREATGGDTEVHHPAP